MGNQGSRIEQQYGSPFTEALKMAQEQQKFVLWYLQLPGHPSTPLFCSNILCSARVKQFLNWNFVCCAALANGSEALRLTATSQPASYPFYAVVAPGSGDNFVVLEQIPGNVSPNRLVDMLKETLEEKGSAYGHRTKVDLVHLDPQPRREQDGEEWAKWLVLTPYNTEVDEMEIKIWIPNNGSIVQSFKSTDKIQAIYGHIESRLMTPIGNCELRSGETVYDQREMTLREAGLYHGASLSLVLL